MKKSKKVFALLATLFALIAPTTYAQVSQDVIDMTDRGWYDRSGAHTETNQNTITGPGYNNDTNSWFLFDLSTIRPGVCSATLRLEMETWSAGSITGESSIWDVSTAPTILVQSHNSGDPEGIAITIDLETGANYANKTVFQSDVGSVLEFPLSAQAVLDINAAAGNMFAVGTHLTAVDQNTWLRWSSGSEDRVHQLVLDSGPNCGFVQSSEPVPIPASAWVIIATLMLLFGFVSLRRARRH
jgi:hypothetical protein